MPVFFIDWAATGPAKKGLFFSPGFFPHQNTFLPSVTVFSRGVHIKRKIPPIEMLWREGRCFYLMQDLPVDRSSPSPGEGSPLPHEGRLFFLPFMMTKLQDPLLRKTSASPPPPVFFFEDFPTWLGFSPREARLSFKVAFALPP